MTVKTFVQPNHAAAAPEFNWKTAVDNAIGASWQIAGDFSPHEATVQNMTVVVDAGTIQSSTTVTTKAQQTTGTITAPAANPRIDRIVIDDTTGDVSVITGAEAASPSAPALTAGKIAVAQAYLIVGQTQIKNADLTDERPLFGPVTQTSINSLTTRITTAEADIDTLESKLPQIGTPQATTSGTAKDFTGIPSWATHIKLNLVGVSTNGTSAVIIQLGDAGGIETTGYSNAALKASGATSVVNDITIASGFPVSGDNNAATRIFHGTLTLVLQNSSSFTWVGTGSFGASETGRMIVSAGSKSTSAALTQVRLTTVGGVDTFDAGEWNIWYE